MHADQAVKKKHVNLNPSFASTPRKDEMIMNAIWVGNELESKGSNETSPSSDMTTCVQSKMANS